MKTLQFLLVPFGFLFVAFATRADVLTVNNMPNGGAQYTTIQAAVNAAKHGDTIYIQASGKNYDGFRQENKRLYIVGPGMAPEKDNAGRAVINGQCHIDNAGATADATCSGSAYEGLVFLRSLQFGSRNISGGRGGVNNIRIARCEFRGTGADLEIGVGGDCSNYIIQENFFFYEHAASNSNGIKFAYNYVFNNFLFQNNVFLFKEFAIYLGPVDNNKTNFIFDHNLFYRTAGSGGAKPVFGAPGGTNPNPAHANLMLSNNIFVNTDPGAHIAQSTFNSNLLYFPTSTATPEPWSINSNIDGGNNLFDVDPQLYAQAEVNDGKDDVAMNFAVSAGPAKDAASDGADIGLLFGGPGALNWENALASRLPIITTMNILNPTLGMGDELNVEITAAKQD